MKVTIIGAGKMGHAIGTRAVAGGHEVEIIDNDPAEAEALADDLGESATPVDKGSIGGEIVVLALYFPSIPTAIEENRNELAGTLHGFNLMRRARLDARRFGAGDDDLLVAADQARLASGRSHGGDTAAMRPERRRVRLDVGAIEPHALHREDGVGRVELDGLTGRHLAKIERGEAAR